MVPPQSWIFDFLCVYFIKSLIIIYSFLIWSSEVVTSVLQNIIKKGKIINKIKKPLFIEDPTFGPLTAYTIIIITHTRVLFIIKQKHREINMDSLSRRLEWVASRFPGFVELNRHVTASVFEEVYNLISGWGINKERLIYAFLNNATHVKKMGWIGVYS